MRYFLVICLLIAVMLGIFIWGSGADVKKTIRESASEIQNSLSKPATRFLVIGDNHGVNPVYAHALEYAVKNKADFVLNLADLTENGTAQEFAAVKELEQKYAVPVYHTLGTHDLKTDASGALYSAAFQPRWYSKNVGGVHLVVLDNANRKVGFPGEELAWLAQDLAANKQPITVLAYHRPFGYPLADLLGDDETPASRLTNDAFLALIKKYPITRIYNAHLHAHLTYTLENMPVEISGGGGDPAQAILGGPSKSFFHAIFVTVRGSDFSSQVVPLSSAAANPPS